MQSNIRNNYLFYFFLIIFIFLFSNLLPWTNPYPGQGVYKPFEKIIFFWQYNADTPGEILASFKFPDYFNKVNVRIERPGYLIPSHIFGKFYEFILTPFFKFHPVYYGALGYLTTKFIFYLIAMICLYEISKKYLKKNSSLILLFFLFTQWESVRMSSQLMNTEFNFIFPIIATFLFLKAKEQKKNLGMIFIFSILLGFLISVKHNIAIILAITIYCLYKKYFLQIIVMYSGIIVFPIFYFFYLKINNIEMYFYLWQSDHSYGSWLIFSDLKIILTKLLKAIFVFFKYSFDYYFIFLITLLLFLKKNYHRYKEEIIFFGILVFFTFVQGFAAQKFGRFFFPNYSYHTRAYMVGDFSFIIFGFSMIYLDQINFFKKKFLFPTFVVFWLLYTSTFFLNLPWKHPYDHPTRDWHSRMKNF
jgi:hypothetical protein